MLCQIVVGPQFKNFLAQCCLFPWSQGLGYPKISNNKKLKRFSGLWQGGTYSLIFWKGKNEEILQKHIYFDLVQIKHSFAHFRKIKNDTKLNKNLKCYCCRLFFDALGMSLQIFWKLNFWRESDAGTGLSKLPIFGNWVPKNIPVQQKCVRFQKLRKSAKSLHPAIQCTALLDVSITWLCPMLY